MILFLLIPIIMMFVGQWIVYKKADVPGWYTLIPFLNVYTRAKFSGTTKYFWVYAIFTVIVSVLTSAQDVLSLLLINAGVLEGTAILSIISLVVAIIAFVFAVQIEHGVARVFGKGNGFGVGLVLLPFIFYPIIAFGNSQYIPSVND